MITLTVILGWFASIFTSLTGLSIIVPTPPAVPLTAEQVIDLEVQAEREYMRSQGTENLTAEQVIDLEVKAEQAFKASGGQY